MTTTTRIRPCGESALLLECADLAAAVGLAERIENARTGAVDVVAAARTVLVTARDASAMPQLRRALEPLLAPSPTLNPAPSPAPFRNPLLSDSAPSPAPLRNPLLSGRIRYPYGSSESAGGVADSGLGESAGEGEGDGGAGDATLVTIDVRYDGADLADVAAMAELSVEALVRTHTSILWRAAFGGFAPGFFYLVDERELDTAAHPGQPAPQGPQPQPGSTAPPAPGPRPPVMPTVPRLDSPRPRVPAGSVAVADRFCAVYPGASPGGWRLLGTTDAPLWDIDRPRPALLAPGTRVRFRDRAAGEAS